MGTNDTGVFDRPLIIISAPRAGSTLLYETLSESAQVWTIGGEAQSLVESVPELSAANRGYESHRLTDADALPERVELIRRRFMNRLQDRSGRLLRDLPSSARPQRLRFIEKTPRNALRVSFMNALFPDAFFVFLHRDALENVASIIEAWLAPGFWQYKGDLPGWDREEWCMLLPIGWRDLTGKDLPVIAAAQWAAANDTALDDLEQLSSERWCTLDFADFVLDPKSELQNLCTFAGLTFDEHLAATVNRPLTPSSSVVTPPRPEKWRNHEPGISEALLAVEKTVERLRSV